MMATYKEKKAATAWNSFSPCVKFFPYQSNYMLIKILIRSEGPVQLLTVHATFWSSAECLCGWRSRCYLSAHVQYKENECESYTVTDIFISNSYFCVFVLCWERRGKQVFLIGDIFSACCSLRKPQRQMSHGPSALPACYQQPDPWNK